jgi:hypothetical protein
MRAVVPLVVTLLALAPLAGSARTDAYPAGPYTVTVTRNDPVDVDRSTGFAVTVAPSAGAGVVAITLPGPGTAGRPGRAVTASGGGSGRYVVTATFPVRGAWVLALDVSGAAGHGRAVVPVTAAAPGAIPVWLGWTIGLSPLAGLAAFLAVQVRAARRLRLSARPPARSARAR